MCYINLIFTLKKSRTASKICLFLHYFVSILQILYCFCRIYNYYTLAKVIQPKIFYLILLLGLYTFSQWVNGSFFISAFIQILKFKYVQIGMALFLTSLTLILPCAAAVHLFQNSIFFEGLEELQKHSKSYDHV